MIAITINSQTAPKEIFQLQANAESLEDWSNGTKLFVRNFNQREYYKQLGENYLKWKKCQPKKE